MRVESDATLLGDEPEIHSAFSNLVDNAAKYTPARWLAADRWWTDDEGGHFSVIDTGIGIPPDHIPRLTERFYRVDAGRTARPAARAWAWRSSSTCCSAMARVSRSRARRARQYLHLQFSLRPALLQPVRARDSRDRLAFRRRICRSQKDLAALSSKRHEPPRPLSAALFKSYGQAKAVMAERHTLAGAAAARPAPCSCRTSTWGSATPGHASCCEFLSGVEAESHSSGWGHHRCPEPGTTRLLERRHTPRCCARCWRGSAPAHTWCTSRATTMRAWRCSRRCCRGSSRCIASGCTAAPTGRR